MKSIFLFFLLIFLPARLLAERYALVIGNNDYPNFKKGNLNSPVNDATDIATALKAQGYIIVGKGPVTNASRRQMMASIQALTVAAKGAEAAVLYFSGHGAGVGGDQTYLLPSDTPAQTPRDTYKNQTVFVQEDIMKAMTEAGIKIKIIILDSCRVNPFAERLDNVSAKAGTAQKTKSPEMNNPYGRGFFHAFATSQGAPAFDGGAQRNSPFTAAMLQAMPTSVGKEIGAYFREVRERLGGDQVSWISDSMPAGDFYFIPRPANVIERDEPVNPPRLPVAATPYNATKTNPYLDSQGQPYVPAGTPGVLFCKYVVRRLDFKVFVDDTKYDAVSNGKMGSPAFTLEKTGLLAGWKQAGGSWIDPRFQTPQTKNDPVVCISYLDAESYCRWLTETDRAKGLLPQDRLYRLPTDDEWSVACGKSEFPWGDKVPPQATDGNYAGKEAMVGVWSKHPNPLAKEGFEDGHARTSPVGFYRENEHGLFDMGGNVWQWCSTWYRHEMNSPAAHRRNPALKDNRGGQTFRVVRGGAWRDMEYIALRSGCRNIGTSHTRRDDYGFRCVVGTVK